MKPFLRIAGCALATVSLLAAGAAAQNPRASVQLNPSAPSNAGQVGAASADDLSAVCWSDTTSSEVFVATSDGRGTSWAAAVRVDNDAFAKTTQTDSVHITGDHVHVVWEANSNLYFARSLDRGLSYSTPMLLDDGGGNVRDWRVALGPDPLGDHVYVLVSTAIGDEDLFLTASHDGGASFSAAVQVPSVGSLGDVDALALAADGNTVHVAWDDNRSGRDSVYYQRSIDGGTSFLATDVALGDSVGIEDSNSPIELALSGATVAVLWNEEPTGSGNEVIQVNVSTNAGLTWGGPKNPGTYSAGSDDTDFGDVAVDPLSLNVIATWEDDRIGGDQAYVAVSTDGGASFGPDFALSVNGAEKPWILGLSGDRSSATIVWESTVSFPRAVEASLSTDAGLSWGSAFTVSDNTPDTVDFVTGAHNALYGNFIGAWTSLNGSDFNVYAGGFRPQTLTAQGMASGAASNFGLSGFRGSDPLVWVLLSFGTSNFPLGFDDGRILGLDPLDSLFGISLANPGLFLTPLDASGAGATPTAPNPLPPGFSFFAAAVSFQTTPTVVLGELTDVAAVVVQ